MVQLRVRSGELICHRRLRAIGDDRLVLDQTASKSFFVGLALRGLACLRCLSSIDGLLPPLIGEVAVLAGAVLGLTRVAAHLI